MGDLVRNALPAPPRPAPPAPPPPVQAPTPAPAPPVTTPVLTLAQRQARCLVNSPRVSPAYGSELGFTQAQIINELIVSICNSSNPPLQVNFININNPLL